MHIKIVYISPLKTSLIHTNTRLYKNPYESHHRFLGSTVRPSLHRKPVPAPTLCARAQLPHLDGRLGFIGSQGGARLGRGLCGRPRCGRCNAVCWVWWMIESLMWHVSQEGHPVWVLSFSNSLMQAQPSQRHNVNWITCTTLAHICLPQLVSSTKAVEPTNQLKTGSPPESFCS